MSPREKEVLSYQAQEVELPDDHCYKDDIKYSKPSEKSPSRKIWLATSLVGVLGLLYYVLVVTPRFDCMNSSSSRSCVQPDKQKTSSSTLQRIDDQNHDDDVVVDRILLDLNQEMEGRVWLASQDDGVGFAQAARVWRQDLKPPRAVVEAVSERDVQLAVPILGQIQKEHGVPFRIRSGGHSKAGFSTVAGGIMLSLKELNTRSILVQGEDYDDPANSNVLATIEPGSTVEDVLDKFLEHATTKDELYGGAIGQCGRVAEGGWVLGGGVGYMARLLGLGLDNALGFRVVLANGTAVSANEQEHPELFWALRGAGQGNYGVVTAMNYQLYRVPDLQLFQKVMIPIEDIGNFFYQLGELKTDGEFFAVSGGTGLVVTIWFSWFSLDQDIDKNIERGNRHFQQELLPILPQSATFSETYDTFLWAEETHNMFDQGYGEEVYAAQTWQGFLMPANNTLEVWTTIMDIIAEGIKLAPEVHPHIELWGGRISKVDVEATAFPYREAVYDVGMLLVVQDYSDDAQERFEQQVASVNSWWPRVAEYLTGSYLNYPMPSLREDEYARLYWGDHLERLVDIKRRYDPENIFVFEQSVPLEL